MEDIYDQIVRQDLLKNDNISKHRVQTALKSFTYSYLDLDFKILGLIKDGLWYYVFKGKMYGIKT